MPIPEEFHNTHASVEVCADPDDNTFSVYVSIAVDGRPVVFDVSRYVDEENGDKDVRVCFHRLPQEIPPNLLDPSAFCPSI
ncbi:MAG: hypothetical protein ABR613_06555 [Actinomycetota bacterium]